MYHYSRILYVKLISLLTTAAQNVHFKLSLSLDALLSSNVFMKLLQLLYIDNELCLYSHHALLLEHACIIHIVPNVSFSAKVLCSF